MRTREEIEKEVSGWNSTEDAPGSFERCGLQNQALIIELLLDIRDRLAPKGPKTVFPPSAPPPVLDEKGRPR